MAKQSRNRLPAAVPPLAPGSAIRFETPKSNRKPKPNPAIVVVQEVNPVGGFINFLREYAVVGLAVGFIIGLQAQTLVKQLVSSFIDPAFQLFFGQALQKRTFTLSFADRHIPFGWGAFVYVLFDFLFVLAAIYAIVKFFSLDKLDKPKKNKKKEESHEATVIR
jgi:large conductance mechanosensitive channel